MSTNVLPNFINFLHNEVSGKSLPVSTSRNGQTVISQSTRNKLRSDGLAALYTDLKAAFDAANLDLLETKNGFLLVAEAANLTFTWEFKSAIKGIEPSYDPFAEAQAWDDEKARRAKVHARSSGAGTVNN